MKNAFHSILILTTAVFLTGLAENIFIGVLPDVAEGLAITEADASSLISVFSLTYAVYAPFAAVVAFHVNTKTALLASLAVFALSNLSILLPETGLLLINSTRILTAMASAQISVCAVICAVNLVQQHYRARAIGTVYLGISGSLFLGVPAGVWITHLSGWRITGLSMMLLAVLTFLLVAFRLPSVAPSGQGGNFRGVFFNHLRDTSQLFGQLVSILFVAGHFVLFTYLTSYAASKGFGGPAWEVLVYTVFGLSGVTGGILAGTVSDLMGRRAALLASPAVYILATLLLAASESAVVFFGSLSLWACASWSISPVVQSYLIDLERSPRDVIIGANTTAMHLGVAGGAIVGGRLLVGSDVSVLPLGAAALAICALVFAGLSICLTLSAKKGAFETGRPGVD